MALTIAPDFTDGIVSAAKLQQLSDAVNDRTPLFARVTTTQNLTASTTTLQNVTELAVALEANASYWGELYLTALGASGATEDIKLGFTFPTGCVVDMFPIGPGSTTTSVSLATVMQLNSFPSLTSGSSSRDFGVTTGFGVIHLGLRIANGSTAGTLQLQAAQNTSGLNLISVVASSSLVGWRVA